MKIKQNSNKEEVDRIRAAIKANDGYCCCSLEKIPETKCMCAEFRESVEKGPCHCGLYIKE